MWFNFCTWDETFQIRFGREIDPFRETLAWNWTEVFSAYVVPRARAFTNLADLQCLHATSSFLSNSGKMFIENIDRCQMVDIKKHPNVRQALIWLYHCICKRRLCWWRKSSFAKSKYLGVGIRTVNRRVTYRYLKVVGKVHPSREPLLFTLHMRSIQILAKSIYKLLDIISINCLP